MAVTVPSDPLPVDSVSIERFILASKDVFLQLQLLSSMAERLAKGPGKVSDICELTVALRDMKELLETPVKEIGSQELSLSYGRLPELFDEDGIRTQTTQGGTRVNLTSRVQASTVDVDRMMAWLRDNNYESLIKETVNASALGAAVREYMENHNKEPPLDAIRVKVTPYVSITKASKGKVKESGGNEI